MANVETLKERYVKAYDSFGNETGIKNELTNNTLKNDMIEFARECGIEIDNRMTKDEIAEKLVSPEIYENISKRKEKEEEPCTSVATSFKLLPSMHQHSSLSDARQTLSKRVEDNVRTFINSNIERWESMEEESTSRAKEFQRQIENLEDEGIFVEEYKEISVIWRNFFNKMTARLLKTSSNLRERNDRLMDIINKYDGDVRDTLGEGDFRTEDFGRFYTLWMEMTEDVREEVEKTGKDFVVDYDELSDTWEKYSEKIIRILNDFRDNRKEQGDELYKSWNRIFEDVNDQISRGIDDSRNWYQDVWNIVSEQSTVFLKPMIDGPDENYSTLLNNTPDIIWSSYNRTLSMSERNTGFIRKEMDELRERLANMEKKLE